jgi:nicotinamidase-related amidase
MKALRPLVIDELEDPDLQNWRHLCIDMQRIFAEDTPWHVEWMDRVSPQVTEIAGRHAERTIFTRFVPPRSAADLPGKWREYYTKWWMMTGEHVDQGLIDLVEPLGRLAPPATIFDKYTYSPWHDGRLHHHLTNGGVDGLAISGGETDVCVLATVLGAIDHGYDVVLLEDAVCGSADETHEASLTLLRNRFSVQLSVISTEKFLSSL